MNDQCRGRRGTGTRGLCNAICGMTVMLALAGLTTYGARTAEARSPVKSLKEMRVEGVVLQERDLSCGAAVLATLLTYQHGDPVSETAVARELIKREEYLAVPELVKIRQGFSLLDLKRYVESRGYQGVGYGELTLEDLIDLAPVVVPVDFTGYPHFVIFRGIAADRAVLADPAFGNRTIQVQRFEDAWLESPAFGKVGFIVERRDGKAPPNLLAPRRGDLLTPRAAALRQVVFPQ